MKERSNISLKPIDDIFSTKESRADAQREKVTMVSLEELHPSSNYPFKVVYDDAYLMLRDNSCWVLIRQLFLLCLMLLCITSRKNLNSNQRSKLAGKE